MLNSRYAMKNELQLTQIWWLLSSARCCRLYLGEGKKERRKERNNGELVIIHFDRCPNCIQIYSTASCGKTSHRKKPTQSSVRISFFVIFSRFAIWIWCLKSLSYIIMQMIEGPHAGNFSENETLIIHYMLSYPICARFQLEQFNSIQQQRTNKCERATVNFWFVSYRYSITLNWWGIVIIVHKC